MSTNDPSTRPLTGFSVRDDTVPADKLPDILIGDDVDQAAPGAAAGEPVTVKTISEETVRLVLSMLFKAGQVKWGHEHWFNDEQEDLDLMVPLAIPWISRYPALVQVMEQVENNSFPAVFLYVYGKRVIVSIRIDRARQQAEERGEKYDDGPGPGPEPDDNSAGSVGRFAQPALFQKPE